jgi:L-asparaginase
MLMTQAVSRMLNICLLLIGFYASLCAQTPKSGESGRIIRKPSVAIITTGGTIAEKVDPKTGAAIPAVSGDDLIKAVPQLGGVAEIKVFEFSDIDSSQMTPELWLRLSRTVDAVLKGSRFAGAVITHGTDTMAEGAFFLDLTLKTKKPVVFVGAMRNASDLSPDGPANLLGAVVQVCSLEAKNWGVTVTMNQYVNAARDVVKTETTNVQTFDSGEKGYLGYIAAGRVVRFHDPLHRQKLPRPDRLPEVVLLTTYAGDKGNLIRHAADAGVEGMVIEGLGAGNVSVPVFEAIKYALSKGIPVVISTRVKNGGVYPLYGDRGGGKTLEDAGAVLAGDLDGPKARILLMLALPAVKGDRDRLKDLF